MSSHEITTSSHTGSSVKEGDIDGSPRGQCDLLDIDAEDATAVARPSTSPTILAPCVGPRRQVVDTTTYVNDTEMDRRKTLVDTAEPLGVASESEVTSSSILQVVGVSLVSRPRNVVDLTRGDAPLGDMLTTDEDASVGNEGARMVGFRLNIAPNNTNSSSVSHASDHGFGDEDESDKQLQILHLRPLDLQPPISGTQSVLLALPERSFRRGFGSVRNSQTAIVKEFPYLPRASELQLRQQNPQRQQLLKQQLQLQRMQQQQRHQLHQKLDKHVQLYERHYQVDQLQLHQQQLDQQVQLRERHDQLDQLLQFCAPPGGFLKNLHSELKPGGLAVIEELVETKNESLPPAVEYHSHRSSRTEKRSGSSRGSRGQRQRLVTSAAPNESDNGPCAICDIEISLARSNSCNSTTEQTIGDFNREIKDDEAQRVIINFFSKTVRKTVNRLLLIFWLMLYYLAIWLVVALFTFSLLRFVLLLTSDGSRYPYYMGPHSCCLHGAQITFRPGWKSDGAAEYNADVKSQRRAVIEQLQAAAQVEEQAGGKGQTRDCANLEDEDGSRKLRPEEMHEMQLLKPCGGAADFAARARSFLSRIPGRPVVLVQLLRRIGYLPARPGGVRIACRSEPPMPLVHASLFESGVGRELDTNATYGRVPSGFFPALSGRHWLPPVLVALPDAPDIWGTQRVRLLCQSTDGGDAEDAPERMMVLSLRRRT